MKRVSLSEQVVKFLRSLPPEPKHRLKQAIQQLPQGRGDIKALEGESSAWWRLRVGPYRVVFRIHQDGSDEVWQCAFAERRSIVYEVFAHLLQSRLSEQPLEPGAAKPVPSDEHAEGQ